MLHATKPKSKKQQPWITTNANNAWQATLHAICMRKVVSMCTQVYGHVWVYVYGRIPAHAKSKTRTYIHVTGVDGFWRIRADVSWNADSEVQNLDGMDLTERNYLLTDFDGLAIYFDGKALFVDGFIKKVLSRDVCTLKVLSRDVCTPPELMAAGVRSCHHAEAQRARG